MYVLRAQFNTTNISRPPRHSPSRPLSTSQPISLFVSRFTSLMLFVFLKLRVSDNYKAKSAWNAAPEQTSSASQPSPYDPYPKATYHRCKTRCVAQTEARSIAPMAATNRMLVRTFLPHNSDQLALLSTIDTVCFRQDRPKLHQDV